MSGILSLVVSFFGIAWTVAAASMGAHGFLLLFGVVFAALGVVQAIYSFKNAAGKNRFSAYDITEDGEEPDPLQIHDSYPALFCPYCGCVVHADHLFCKHCGKKIT
ncbi:MAG: zinc ribbon domain-containing protein [Oscillospiraceae bacterium]|nr:zinc ribbon domain-containing protein [Oscillospiraceae bacterium]